MSEFRSARTPLSRSSRLTISALIAIERTTACSQRGPITRQQAIDIRLDPIENAASRIKRA